VTHLDRKNIDVIRPLIYAEEKDIRGFVRASGITPVPNPCNANGRTRRQYVKELLKEMAKDNREVKSNIFGAIKRSSIHGWEAEDGKRRQTPQETAKVQPRLDEL